MPLRLSLSACLIALAVVALLGAAVVWAIGSKLIAVEPHPVALPGLDAEDVPLRPAPDQQVAGSFLAGRGRGAVLLLHGIHGDRRDMAARARFLHAQGYAVLLIDLPGQGASTASAVTFGHAPVLVAAGGADQHTTLPETQRLFAAAAQPKELWVVEGAAHVDLHAYAPEAYERRIGAFLSHHLDPVPITAGR